MAEKVKPEIVTEWVVAKSPKSEDILGLPHKTPGSAFYVLRRNQSDFPKTYKDMKVYKRISVVSFTEATEEPS